MRDSPLPAGWQWAKLGEICEIVNGSTPQSGLSEYWNGSICWITPTDLGQLVDPYVRRSARTITKEGYESCSTTVVPAGAVLMSSRAPIGHLGIAAIPLCTNQGCKSFIPTEAVKTKFLYYALGWALDDIRALGSGATFPEVGKKKLAEFPIALPPLDQQSRISEWLDDWLSVLNRLRGIIAGQLAVIDAMAQALLRDVFPQSPTSRPDRGWRWTTLEEVCHINPPRPSELRVPPDTSVTFVPMAAVSDDAAAITHATVRPYKDVSRGYTYMQDGDVIFAKITPCMQNGKHAVVRDTLTGWAFGSTEFHVLRPSANLDARLLHAFLLRKEFLQDAERNFKGTAGQQRVPKEFLASTPFPLPPVSKQHRLVADLARQFSALERVRTAAQAQLCAADVLSRAALHQAFES